MKNIFYAINIVILLSTIINCETNTIRNTETEYEVRMSGILLENNIIIPVLLFLNEKLHTTFTDTGQSINMKLKKGDTLRMSTTATPHSTNLEGASILLINIKTKHQILMTQLISPTYTQP